MRTSNTHTPSPAVSVIMPCLNGSKFISAAIDSVLNQSYGNFELIIVDNNSTDSSLELAYKYKLENPRIRVLRCRHAGAAHARNLGISSSKGRYIAFLDCDDLWDINKLEIQLQAMTDSRASFSWSSYRVIDEMGRLKRAKQASPHISHKDLLSKRKTIGCLTAIYDSHTLGLQQMPDILMRQDFGLWSNLIKLCEVRGLAMVGVQTPLASYRMHSGAMTKNKLRAFYYQWYFYRTIEKLGPYNSLKYMLLYTIYGIADRQ